MFVNTTHEVQLSGIVADEIIEISRLYPDPYCRNLRAKLSAINSVPVQEVLVDAGADSLIFLALRVRVNVGDVVVTTAGTYPTFKYFAEGVGAQLVEVPYKEERKGLSVDLEALCTAATKHSAALVYIANPDNPTGHVHSAESIESLRGSLPESTTLVVDEAYIDFSPNHSLRLVPRSEAWRNTIQLRTLSKAYGLAGARTALPLRLHRPRSRPLTEGGRPRVAQGCAWATPSRTRSGSTRRTRSASTSPPTTSPTTSSKRSPHPPHPAPHARRGA
jgi:histidinol-phosphate/aromatic aminotransferase/cobyric acid decarboxylase-like protein